MNLVEQPSSMGINVPSRDRAIIDKILQILSHHLFLSDDSLSKNPVAIQRSGPLTFLEESLSSLGMLARLLSLNAVRSVGDRQ